LKKFLIVSLLLFGLFLMIYSVHSQVNPRDIIPDGKPHTAYENWQYSLEMNIERGTDLLMFSLDIQNNEDDYFVISPSIDPGFAIFGFNFSQMVMRENNNVIITILGATEKDDLFIKFPAKITFNDQFASFLVKISILEKIANEAVCIRVDTLSQDKQLITRLYDVAALKKALSVFNYTTLWRF